MANGKITADEVWRYHRAALNGVSAATGAELPRTLTDNAILGVKMSHYGIALGFARNHGMPDPPIPEGVSEEQAREVFERLDKAGCIPWEKRG